MELKGTFKKATPIETGVSKSGTEFKKQTFTIETDGQYPKTVAFSLFGDRTDLIHRSQPGDVMTVRFDAESREYNGKFYTDLKCFGITTESFSQSTHPPSQPETPSQPQITYTRVPHTPDPTPFTPHMGATSTAPESTPVDDDLPF